MSWHDSKYFSTTNKGEIPVLKEELNSQYKVFFSLYLSCVYFNFVSFVSFVFFIYIELIVSIFKLWFWSAWIRQFV